MLCIRDTRRKKPVDQIIKEMGERVTFDQVYGLMDTVEDHQKKTEMLEKQINMLQEQNRVQQEQLKMHQEIIMKMDKRIEWLEKPRIGMMNLYF